MAKTVWVDGKRSKETNPKRTSIGEGRRKKGSYKWKNTKKSLKHELNNMFNGKKRVKIGKKS